jgi:RNA polymerase sigma factor (sigma-70 family)
VVHEGDKHAFDKLVRRHQSRVRAQLRRLLGDNWTHADDLAQETFVLAWRKLEQFRGESRFSTWLYRIAHSCFLQFLRNRATQQKLALDVDGCESNQPALSSLELGLDLDSALRRLSINQRAALLYCEQLGLSHEDAALVLNMPLGSVKTHVLRGKAKLRELLTMDNEEANQ